MIVIEHLITKERFMFPSTNTNIQTPDGFIQVQDTPRGYKLADDQTPVPLYYYQTAETGETTEALKWESNSKDPLNTLDKWTR